MFERIQSAPGPLGEISLFALLSVFVRRWRLISWIIGTGVLLSIVAVLILPSRYTAVTKIVSSTMIEDASTGSGLAALAGAAGSIGAMFGGTGPLTTSLFPDMLKCREVRSKVFSRRYPTRTGEMVDLLDVLKIESEDPQRRLYLATTKTGPSFFSTSTDERTGITTVSVELKDPELAAAVANASIEELNDFIRELRASHAGEETRFIACRVAEVQDTLLTDEETLRDFRVKNRMIVGSPELMLQESRLLRKVAMNEQLFLTLKTQYEVARINELSGLSDAIVLEKATPPIFRSSPKRKLTVFLGAFASGIVALVTVLALEGIRGFTHNQQSRQNGTEGQ